MPLKDMAYTDAEIAERKENMDKCCAMPSDYTGPKYPWGLELRLETNSLEKLGVDISKFKVGQELPMDIIGRVTGISINEREDGERNACLTIVAAQIGLNTKKSTSEQAESLYGKDDR